MMKYTKRFYRGFGTAAAVIIPGCVTAWFLIRRRGVQKGGAVSA